MPESALAGVHPLAPSVGTTFGLASCRGSPQLGNHTYYNVHGYCCYRGVLLGSRIRSGTQVRKEMSSNLNIVVAASSPSSQHASKEMKSNAAIGTSKPLHLFLIQRASEEMKTTRRSAHHLRGDEKRRDDRHTFFTRPGCAYAF